MKLKMTGRRWALLATLLGTQALTACCLPPIWHGGGGGGGGRRHIDNPDPRGPAPVPTPRRPY